VFGREAEILVLDPSLGVDNELPFVQEQIAHLHSLVEEAARVIPKVQHQCRYAILLK